MKFPGWVKILRVTVMFCTDSVESPKNMASQHDCDTQHRRPHGNVMVPFDVKVMTVFAPLVVVAQTVHVAVKEAVT